MRDIDHLETRLRSALRADATRAPLGGMAAPPIAPRPRRASRRLVLVAVPALAAVATVAVVVILGPASSAPAVAATPPMLIFDSHGAPPVARLLSRLEARADESPWLIPSAGEYVYLQSESWDLVVAVSRGSATSTVVPKLRETWSSSSGPKLQVQRAAARVSPGALSVREQTRVRQGVAAGPAHRSVLSAAAVRPFDTLAELPQTPKRLFDRLADPVGYGPSDRSDPVAVGHAMENLRNYLAYSPTTPRFLRALYRMLGTVPGVSDAGGVTDRAGRPGVAIAVPTGGPGARHSFRLIADPQTGQLLGLEDIQLDPSAVNVRTPCVFSYDVLLRQRTVSGVGTRP